MTKARQAVKVRRAHLVRQTLLDELQVTADILLIRPRHQQLGAHWGAKTKTPSLSKHTRHKGTSHNNHNNNNSSILVAIVIPALND